MVRLKVGQHFRYVAKSISFQFHYGTIKSFDSFPRAHFEFNFNSTMVRLKVQQSRSAAYQVCNFNSTMVRLKASAQPAVTPTMVFQFHYGTIKS